MGSTAFFLGSSTTANAAIHFLWLTITFTQKIESLDILKLLWYRCVESYLSFFTYFCQALENTEILIRSLFRSRTSALPPTGILLSWKETIPITPIAPSDSVNLVVVGSKRSAPNIGTVTAHREAKQVYRVPIGQWTSRGRFNVGRGRGFNRGNRRGLRFHRGRF